MKEELVLNFFVFKIVFFVEFFLVLVCLIKMIFIGFELIFFICFKIFEFKWEFFFVLLMGDDENDL